MFFQGSRLRSPEIIHPLNFLSNTFAAIGAQIAVNIN